MSSLVCLLLQIKSRPRGEHLAIQLIWAPARLLVTCVSLIYQVDEFFIYSFQVLLKEMRTHGEFKISSCYFCVWCKSREVGGWGSPICPYVVQVVEGFSSDLLGAITIFWVESHLESCQTSTMELSWENNPGADPDFKFDFGKAVIKAPTN